MEATMVVNVIFSYMNDTSLKPAKSYIYNPSLVAQKTASSYQRDFQYHFPKSKAPDLTTWNK